MIEINLLPEELKVKTKKALSPLGSARRLLSFIPLALGILIIIHIFLLGIFMLRSSQLKALSSKWERLKPQRKLVEDFKQEFAALSGDAQTIQQIMKQRIIWSEKLNKLSLDLPSGVWFRELSITEKDFLLQACAVSLQKEEMVLIDKFINNLKSDTAFFKDFTNLELSSVQRQVIGGYDIIDFVLSGKLK